MYLFIINKQSSQTKKTKISITVGEPVTKDTTLSKFTAYNIKGSDREG